MLERIEIVEELGFDEVCERLKNVRLRGFPHIKIYKDADIKIKSFTPKKIKEEVFTPQPSVYKPVLERIEKMVEIFSRERIDVFRLKGGFDYDALNEKDEVTEWTIIPPVIEVNSFVVDQMGFDYSGLIGKELKILMKERSYELNPELRNMPCTNRRRTLLKIPVICDGSHRIELGVRRGLEQNLLFIFNLEDGFPYYAVPAPYSSIHEESERVEEKIDKIHILTAPGHKLLYRLFPSGGINNGTVRTLKQKFD